ncbi:MAG TPA: YMGG-like glycine zipper-containing protein [Gemmatimonadaceae bacterium]|nr:YMGG-like glycine zipper-containing protein [Gemmatimonadaceae bacterium]
MLIPMAQLTDKYLRRAVALAALAVLSLAAACADKAAKTATADSSLTRDLALAGQQASVPSFQDTAVAPAPKPAAIAPKEPPAPVRTPRAARPKNPPPKPVEQAPVQAPAPVAQQPAMAPVPAPSAAPIVSEIGAGSGGTLTSGSKVCSSTNLPGDKLVATLASDVTGTNGAVIPAGSTVVLEVASVTPGQSAETAQLGLHVRSVIVNDKTYNVDATVTPTTPLEKSKIPDADPNADKKKVIGGAIAGAILGQMIGHNTKGTIIGAAAGAATGAAVAKSGGEKWQACLPSGASLRLTLNAPLVISS